MHNPAMARSKQRKPTGVRKDAIIPVRCSEDQKAKISAAAERRGVPSSTWLLMLGLAEAAKDEGKDSPPKAT
jgi:hypothetical protein